MYFVRSGYIDPSRNSLRHAAINVTTWSNTNFPEPIAQAFTIGSGELGAAPSDASSRTNGFTLPFITLLSISSVVAISTSNLAQSGAQAVVVISGVLPPTLPISATLSISIFLLLTSAPQLTPLTTAASPSIQLLSYVFRP